MGWIVRFLPDIEIQQPLTGEEPLSAEAVLSKLWDQGTNGIGELSSGHIVAGFGSEQEAETAAEFLRTQPVRDVVCQPVDDQDWHDQDNVSDVVVPTATGQVSFSVKAGASFGHGDHETTRLILDAMDEQLSKGHTVLDLGTGSGVLAIAAMMIGAGSTVAIDLDPDAVAIAVNNADRNDVAVDCRHTPVDELIDEFRGRFDLVVANVLMVAHQEVASAVVKLLGPEGRVITSGYLPGQASKVVGAYEPLEVANSLKLGPWVGHVLTKRN